MKIISRSGSVNMARDEFPEQNIKTIEVSSDSHKKENNGVAVKIEKYIIVKTCCVVAVWICLVSLLGRKHKHIATSSPKLSRNK